jgi:diadenosine tetraphosphatase ApaH/serine/threonine PP2A family protein phosphatase
MTQSTFSLGIMLTLDILELSVCFICTLSSYGTLTAYSLFVATTSVDTLQRTPPSSANVRLYFFVHALTSNPPIGLHKYSEKVYDACIASFSALPLSGLLDGRFFCAHGGISPELDTLSDIDRINRFREPGSSGLLCDLLWADPVPNFGNETEPSQHPSPIPPGQMWGYNTNRGCSYYFTSCSCLFLFTPIFPDRFVQI